MGPLDSITHVTFLVNDLKYIEADRGITWSEAITYYFHIAQHGKSDVFSQIFICPNISEILLIIA